MINIYKSPIRITDQMINRHNERRLAAVDFRVKLDILKNKDQLFTPGSPVRAHLKIDPGGCAARFSDKDVLRLEAAPPDSLVGETANMAEGVLVLSRMVGILTDDEFMISRNADDAKMYVIKGGQEEVDGFQHRFVSSPFPSVGPSMHTHPIAGSAKPSLGDLRLHLKNGSPFDMTVGHPSGERAREESLVIKYCLFGPLKIFDTFKCGVSNVFSTTLTALSEDRKDIDGCVRAIYYLIRGEEFNADALQFGHPEADIDRILADYAMRMSEWGKKIAVLEADVYPDPKKDIEKALELADMYVSAGHGMNAMALLDKLDEKKKTDEADKIYHKAFMSMLDLCA